MHHASPRRGAAVVTALLSTAAVLVACTALLAVPAEATGPSAAAGGGGHEGRMMLLLDSSGSMAEKLPTGQTKILAARQALTHVVRGLPGEAQVGLRVFGATVFSRSEAGACTDSQQVVAPGTGNRAELLSAVGRYTPYGETPIPFALRQAAADLGHQGARSIVLVSDGESTCRPDPCVVARDLSRQGIDLQIDVVGLAVSGAARAQLRCIADAGNGQYYDASSAADIESRITRAAERALRPFALTGRPIEGGPPSAPTPVRSGDWLDALDSSHSTRSYAFTRTTTGTTLRAAAVTQGSRGNDGIGVRITSPEGTTCDSGLTARALDVRQLLGALATAPTGQGDGCDGPGTYTVQVSRAPGAQGRIPFQLRITEEPPVDDPGSGPSGPPRVSAPAAGTPKETVVGGSSFVTAPSLAPGTHASTVVPGEALVFGVDLAFGQSAQIGVRFPPGSSAVRRALGPSGLVADLALYDPMQATTKLPSGSTFSEPVGASSPVTLATATPAVSRTLVGAGATNGVDDFSTAGRYYVGVSLMRAAPGVASVEVPFTLTVTVDGAPQRGPSYAGGARWTVADQIADTAEAGSPSTGPSPSPSTSPPAAGATGPTSEDPADDPGGSGAGLLVLAVGVLAVVAAGGAALARRRRSTG
ncbi:MAG: vWA domain-containing protein [Marmoricola sp.]